MQRLPMTLARLFDEFGCAVVSKAVLASAVEAALRDHGVSFRTRIVKTKKRGLEYKIWLLR